MEKAQQGYPLAHDFARRRSVGIHTNGVAPVWSAVRRPDGRWADGATYSRGGHTPSTSPASTRGGGAKWDWRCDNVMWKNVRWQRGHGVAYAYVRVERARGSRRGRTGIPRWRRVRITVYEVHHARTGYGTKSVQHSRKGAAAARRKLCFQSPTGRAPCPGSHLNSPNPPPSHTSHTYLSRRVELA